MRTIDRRSNWRRTNGRRPRALARWLLTLVVGLGASGLGETLWAERALRVGAPITSAPVKVDIQGTYRALLIGIDEYKHVPKLEAAVKDVNAVAEVLKGRYGFQDDNIKRLLNEKATEKNILKALEDIKKGVYKEDSVFIYYAGHGMQDSDGVWWVPVEGKQDDQSTQIKDTLIKDYIKGSAAQHIYLVVDSCFSGKVFEKARNVPGSDDISYIADHYSRKSRWALTSGGNEPVADKGKNGHSPFAYYFLEELRKNTKKYLVPDHFEGTVARLVTARNGQEPLSGPLSNSDHDNGRFVFRLTDVTGSQTQGTNSTSGSVSSVNNSAQGGPKKKPEDQWKTMLELLDTLLEEKTS